MSRVWGQRDVRGVKSFLSYKSFTHRVREAQWCYKRVTRVGSERCGSGVTELMSRMWGQRGGRGVTKVLPKAVAVIQKCHACRKWATRLREPPEPRGLLLPTPPPCGPESVAPLNRTEAPAASPRAHPDAIQGRFREDSGNV
eukprot:1187189-Prorocentrum_minimum.AAC.3